MGMTRPHTWGWTSSSSSGIDCSSWTGTVSTELRVPEPEDEPWLDDVGADEELDPGCDCVWDWVWDCDWPLGPGSSDMMFLLWKYTLRNEQNVNNIHNSYEEHDQSPNFFEMEYQLKTHIILHSIYYNDKGNDKSSMHVTLLPSTCSMRFLVSYLYNFCQFNILFLNLLTTETVMIFQA